ncbi:LOW QUALITY PROTEIN: uncharacterized protein LOC115729550 [Rhodamnia argentea]|uniref:LOW QUALITY PROTEIN: uncharacterized protein LOC115729550 n=1 Tax=Rhodamnia argentea TaxID=178133 RepID=A0A8B8N0W3_9MYRT|nr:LOW QUALITY PROTEIN: uncharacterized protein LOC115729550 [Rhodamnia argentea]
MFGCKCLSWNGIAGRSHPQPEPFSLPAPIPQWPPGQGFASGRINLGEIEVCKVNRFEYIWGWNLSRDERKGVSFYRPAAIPDGFFCLGHYCQSNDRPLRGFVLVAREVISSGIEPPDQCTSDKSPALEEPVDYTLVWSSDDGGEDGVEGCFFWLPQAPEGYKPMGLLVTNQPAKPALEEVRVVRSDLTDTCENHHVILSLISKYPQLPFTVCSTRPTHRGMLGKGVSVGTFFCSSFWISGDEQCVSCLKNCNLSLNAMPNLDQVHAVINHYGPTVFFHPDEVFLPSSVSWFFENGSQLYSKGNPVGEPIDISGSNLPSGGKNDGEYWIDLPSDGRKDSIKNGNLDSAKLYVHVKPALGSTFTDIVMWIFCPFNGPATLKVGMSIPLSIGQHVGDWEHFTLRISNFTGELWSIYFSQHSGGQWVDACDLEFIDGNKVAVYSSKSGHASYPHPGTYIQGSKKLGIGIRNDAARSDFKVDSSTSYELVAAEYLGDGVVGEPFWLQYMRKWGPTITYDSRTKLDKTIKSLPVMLGHSVAYIFDKLPAELSGEDGPTGPKEKNNWVSDERG